MPAKKKREAQINLLPQEEFASSTLGRILTWLLSTFRIIVIISEMVVMAAFLSRFWLDAQNTDLNDELKQKQAIIASYSSFEKDFRLAQKRLSIFSALTSSSTPPSYYLGALSSFLPDSIILKSFSYTKGEAQIRASGTSEASIIQYLTSLETSNIFKDVAISQISVDEGDPFINFTVKVGLKGGS